MDSKNSIKVFVEIGAKKTFAGAVDWPGWCRSGRDEKTALQALIDYGPRYAQVLQNRDFNFQSPADGSIFIVAERLDGNATTDFGAPAMILDADRTAIGPNELERFEALLRVCWQAFDQSVRGASDRELRKGPRGGGRDIEKILNHVVEADRQYLRRVAWKLKKESGKSISEEIRLSRKAILSALEAAVNRSLPERGPRGGVIWAPRTFVRRVAWHVLDHAWEIDDRII